MTENLHDRLVQILDQVRAIAQNGLNYCRNPYDLERYNHLLDIAAIELSELTDEDKFGVLEMFARDIGYITPKVGVDAAIFDESERILLHKRSDDGTWCLPCGWVEVGEPVESAIVREVREETGLEVLPTHILGISDTPADRNCPVHIVSILYFCRRISGKPTVSHESTEIGYFDIEAVVNWHKAHEQKARLARKFLQKPNLTSAIELKP